MGDDRAAHPTSAPVLPVVVVGSGLAGLSTAYQALAGGAPVHMIERAKKAGGNSMKASSGINGVPTEYQPAGENDSAELFTEDTRRSAGSRLAGEYLDERGVLIAQLAGSSAEAIRWLVDDIGVDLSIVAALGGHSSARTHRGAGRTPPGAAIVLGLLKKLQANEAFTLTTGANVVGLDTGSPVVVRYVVDGEEREVQGRSIVFATGGFAGDAAGMMARFRPDLHGLPSTNDANPDTAHDLLSSTAGAVLVDMDRVQVHPTGFVDPGAPTAHVKFLAAEALRGEGGILLRDGKRFTNEMATREVVTNAIMAEPPSEGKQWDITLLLDPGACDAAKSHVEFYLWKKLLRRVKIAELDPTTQASIDEYSAIVQSGHDALGRTTFGRWRLAPGDREEEVCIGQVTPVTHFTMGGVMIDEEARLVREGQAPIDGLYAAGEVTGGIHGDNRLGGSSLLECVVFGRIAGTNAAKH